MDVFGVHHDVPGVGRPERVQPALPGARNWQRRQRRPAEGEAEEPPPEGGEEPGAPEGPPPGADGRRVDIVV